MIDAIDTILGKINNDGEVVSQGAFRAVAGLAWGDNSHSGAATAAAAATATAITGSSSGSGTSGSSSSSSSMIQSKFSELPQFCKTVVKVLYNELEAPEVSLWGCEAVASLAHGHAGNQVRACVCASMCVCVCVRACMYVRVCA